MKRYVSILFFLTIITSLAFLTISAKSNSNDNDETLPSFEGYERFNENKDFERTACTCNSFSSGLTITGGNLIANNGYSCELYSTKVQRGSTSPTDTLPNVYSNTSNGTLRFAGDTDAGGLVQSMDPFEAQDGISSGAAALINNNGEYKQFFVKFKYLHGKLTLEENEIKTNLPGIIDVSLSLSYERDGKQFYQKMTNSGIVSISYDKTGNIYINLAKAKNFINSSYDLFVHYGEWHTWKINKQKTINQDNEEE